VLKEKTKTISEMEDKKKYEINKNNQNVYGGPKNEIR
jgi:hypothetical protein